MLTLASFRRSLLPLIAAAAVGAGATAVQAQSYDQQPPATKGLDIADKLGQRVPLDIPFVDSTGKAVKLADAFRQGKPVLLMMVYYRCPLACPMILDRYQSRLQQMDDLTIGTHYNVVVVSFDPTDTPQVAAEHKAMRVMAYGRTPEESVSKGWLWLTSPEPGNARRLADAIGFQYRYMPASGEYAHPTATFILSPDGTLSRYLYGMDTTPRDLKLALVEASQGKIGSTIDKVLLFCFHFDPDAGSYSLAAFRLMRIGGALSALFVGGLICSMLMVERRRRAARTAASSVPPHDLPQNSPLKPGLAR